MINLLISPRALTEVRLVKGDIVSSHVEAIAKPLLHLPLWSAGRAANLVWFHFGSRRTVIDRYGASREVGTYALHIQCMWRILHVQTVYVGEGDCAYSAKSADQPATADEVSAHMTRCDVRLAHLFQQSLLQALRVEDTASGAAGRICLTLTQGYALEVIPDTSGEGEHWRLFQPYTEAPHWVMTGTGLVEE